MGDPYLTSDESLILSTHNISIEGVSLDLMLTSRRLILIDNSVTPFKLRTIPLETIITVVAGMDVKGDPIITLSHMDPSGSGAPFPVDFIFTRQKGEPRVTECNEWAATLSRYAAGAREGALSTGTLPYDPVKAIQPRMSATYGIETFSPRKPVMEDYPVKAEPITASVLPESPVDDARPPLTDEIPYREYAEMDISPARPREPEDAVRPDPTLPGAEGIVSTPAVPEELAESPAPAAPDVEETDERLPVPVPTPEFEPDKTGVDTPLEEITGPENAASPDLSLPKAEGIIITPAVPEELAESPAPAAPDVEETDERLPVPVPTPEFEPDKTGDNTPLEEITGPEEPVSLPPENEPARDESRVITDAERIWAEAARSAVSSPSTIPALVSNEPTPVTRPGEEKPVDEPDTAGSVIEKPVAGIKAEPRPESSPVISPQSPPVIRTKSYPLIPIAAILVVILVVLAGVVIISFSPKNTTEPSLPVVIPVVTVLPVTTPLPTTVPTDGVWVRIDYPGTFIGEVGNPELMHPVSGTGVRLYKILRNDRAVEASAQKQENSGDTLVIEVYNNGTLIKRSSTRAPMGSVSILIDPTTGRPPGINPGAIP